MSLHSALIEVLDRVRISDEGRREYLPDAQIIQNSIIEELKKVDKQFLNDFDGLSLTGNYLDRVKLEDPDEFDVHIKLKFSFKVHPKKKKENPGFIFIRANKAKYVTISHPAFDNERYLDHLKLQAWLRSCFVSVFKKHNENFTVKTDSGKIYSLKCTAKGEGCAHTIVATCGKQEISFDLVPAIQFDYRRHNCIRLPKKMSYKVNNPWFAVAQWKHGYEGPHANKFFMMCAPHWEREAMEDKHNLKDTLRLMKCLRDAHKQNMPRLSSYFLKSVLLDACANSHFNWRNNVDLLLIQMWSKLTKHLQARNIPFYMDNNLNLLDLLTSEDVTKCRNTSVGLLDKLLAYNKTESYYMSIFGY